MNPHSAVVCRQPWVAYKPQVAYKPTGFDDRGENKCEKTLPAHLFASCHSPKNLRLLLLQTHTHRQRERDWLPSPLQKEATFSEALSTIHK